MRRHGQAILLNIFLVFVFQTVTPVYGLFLFNVLAVGMTLFNPYYLIILFVPLILTSIQGKIYLAFLIAIYFLLRLVWYKKSYAIFSYVLITIGTFFFARQLYQYNTSFLFLALGLSLLLGILIIHLSGFSKKQIALLNINLTNLIYLALAFSVLMLQKNEYIEYYLLLFCFLIPFYLPWYNLILLPLVYWVYPELIFIVLLGLILFNYKSYFLYITFFIMYYGFIKGKIIHLDYAFIGTFLAYTLVYLFSNDKETKSNHNYSLLTSEFHSYLTDLETLFQNNKERLQQFQLIHKEISITYCSKCSKRTSCMAHSDITLAFLRSTTMNYGTNQINCPHYESFPRINLQEDIKPLQHDAIKTLLYSFQNDIYDYQNTNEAYFSFIKQLKRHRIKFQNFIPSFYNLSFSIELLEQPDLIKNYFMNLSNFHFKQKLLYKEDVKSSSTFLTVCAQSKITLSYAHAILNKGFNTLSGDNFLVKKTNDGRQIFCLSDGMGSGMEAYYASKELLEVVSNMLKYHFSTNSLLNFLSYIYEIKGDYDAYATLDLLQINTVTSKANLYKLGSTTSFLFSDVDRIFENSNLPLSYNDLIEAYELELKKNDVIVLVSDGFTESLSPQELKQVIRNHLHLSASLIVEQVCTYIKSKTHELTDDCCIIVIKVN